MERPALLRAATGVGRIAQRVLGIRERVGKQEGVTARLAPPLGAWTAWRDLRPLAPRSFRDIWRAELRDASPPRMPAGVGSTADRWGGGQS